jgi:hypothetical protein
MVSVFLPLDGIWGAVRLAKPRSLWAKWFYRSHPEQMTKAHVRLGASDARVKRSTSGSTTYSVGIPRSGYRP